MRHSSSFTWARAGLAAAALAGFALAAPIAASAASSLTIESWRNDDLDIWMDKIIPAFNKSYPDIKVVFAPMPPADYNAGLNTKLAGGTAGDLITCRPFDASLELFKRGSLASLNGLEGLDSFSNVAKSAWQTDDGATTFCLPMASVIHGFIYNKEIFSELGLSVPKTIDQFNAALATIKAKSKYTPIALGTSDQWESATMGFQNIGPNFWKGEDGRQALIKGTQKSADAAYIKTWEQIAAWGPFMGKGFKAQKYPDTQNLFSLGRAAIYPAGSWDISTFNKQADFKFGAFPPPLPVGQSECYISDHTDIGLGINKASKNMAAAKTFLNWMATAEFAELYANALPGFFPLGKHKVKLDDPVAQQFVDWRGTCKSTIRNSYQILSRGTPNLENDLWNVSAQVLNGTLSPQQAAAKAQAGLNAWYKPHQ